MHGADLKKIAVKKRLLPKEDARGSVKEHLLNVNKKKMSLLHFAPVSPTNISLKNWSKLAIKVVCPRIS